MPGMSVPPEVSTRSPAKPTNSPAGATFLTLPSSSRTAWPSKTFSPSNTRPPTYNVAIAQNSFRKDDAALSSGGALTATQRIVAGVAALRLKARDLGIDSHDVRVVLLGELEGGNGAAGFAHLGADHAKAGIG